MLPLICGINGSEPSQEPIMNFKASAFIAALFCILSKPVWGSEITEAELVLNETEGLVYQKFTEKPYSGRIIASSDSLLSGRYNKGLKDGEWHFFHANGLIHKTGDYEDGNKVDFWNTFDLKGKLILTEHFTNGTPTNGTFSDYHYYPSKEKVRYEFKNGLEISRIEFHYQSDYTLTHKTYFDNDKEVRHQLFNYHFGTDQVFSEQNYLPANASMLAQIGNTYDFHRVFREEGTLHGPYIEYNLTGNKTFQGNMVNGYLQGTVEQYYENGALEIRETRLDGWLNGMRQRYYLDGDLAEEDEYKMGYLYKGISKADGEFNYFFTKAGTLRKSVNYILGQKHGDEKIYYANGKLKEEQGWWRGKRHGERITYTRTGEIDWQTEYVYGTLANK